jgi:uncharacterized protein (TIGR00725 family)
MDRLKRRSLTHLLTGAGQGVMEAVSRGFCLGSNRTGLCIGVVPTLRDDEYGYVPKAGYPNDWIELAISSPLSTFEGVDPHQVSRNHIIIFSSDIVIALPGSKGTLNEVGLARQFKKPLVLFGERGSFG